MTVTVNIVIELEIHLINDDAHVVLMHALKSVRIK